MAKIALVFALIALSVAGDRCVFSVMTRLIRARHSPAELQQLKEENVYVHKPYMGHVLFVATYWKGDEKTAHKYLDLMTEVTRGMKLSNSEKLDNVYAAALANTLLTASALGVNIKMYNVGGAGDDKPKRFCYGHRLQPTATVKWEREADESDAQFSLRLFKARLQNVAENIGFPLDDNLESAASAEEALQAARSMISDFLSEVGAADKYDEKLGARKAVIHAPVSPPPKFPPGQLGAANAALQADVCFDTKSDDSGARELDTPFVDECYAPRTNNNAEKTNLMHAGKIEEASLITSDYKEVLALDDEETGKPLVDGHQLIAHLQSPEYAEVNSEAAAVGKKHGITPPTEVYYLAGVSKIPVTPVLVGESFKLI